jgi:outer membrane receptor protein involved in Fe transport
MMKVFEQRVIARLLATTFVGLIAQPALAQAQNDDAQLEASQSDVSADADADSESIVITGSRIPRAGYDQPTPVTIQTSEILLSSAPTTLADGLNRLPQLQGSRTRTFCCEVGSVGNFLNLRGLGTTRTLVLLDSRRVVATRESGDVDVNLLPEILVDRVDIVTGGASAAYGSDAVSGVVNYIINNKFSGVRANVQRGLSTYGDDATTKLAAAIGSSFGSDDRGHFVLSVDHFKQDGIPSLDSRPQSRRGAFMGGNGTAAAPFVTLEGIRQATAAYGGVIVGPSNLPIPGAGAPLAGTQFLPGGATAPFVFGTPVAGSPGFYVGGDGILNNLADPAQALRADRIYGRISYEVADWVTAWARVNAGESRTQGDILADNRQTTVAYTIFRENAFLPAAVAARMDAAGVSSFRLARFNRDFGPIRLDYTNRTVDIAAGFEGAFGDGWRWNASYSHGETEQDSRVENVGEISRIYAQADAVRDPANGNIVCRVTLTNPGLYPGCVPVNLFGEGAPSQAAKDYALQVSTQNVRNTQEVFQADLQGDLFELPAGAVSVAFGGEYRKRSLHEVSNAVALNQIRGTGIRGLPSALCPTVATCRFGGWQQGNFGEANASDDVKEGFVELVVPLLKDTPFFHALEFNGAYRYTDYENSGGVSTWKLGLSWAPFADLRFRGTTSRDIRAPNLFELFAGPVMAFQPGLTDPFTGQTNIIAITRTQGNPDLSPERADTFTLGAVYTPGWLPGLEASIDYYDIDIGGALGATTAQGTVNACFQKDAEACARITRDANQTIQQVVLQQINLNSRLVRGVDFDLSYNRPLAGGRIALRLLANHALDYVDTVGGVRLQQAGFYNTANQLTVPEWRGNLSVNYDKGPFGLFVQERYIGSYTQLPPLPGQIFARPKIDAVFYTDLTLRYEMDGLFGSDVELYGTVNNVFNQKPRFIGNRFAAGLGYPTAPGLYDLDDRYFSIGARLKL